MKLVRKHLEKDGSGSITLCPEESEDMWHTYNLLQPDDRLKATAVRRVVNETATGTTTKSTVRITLTIQVETVFFDSQACTLRVNGRNVEENRVVKMGSYHTLDLELHRNFTLSKTLWDRIALDRVTLACDVAQRADVAAVVLQEGLANVCLVTNHMTIVRQRIEASIPRKRRGGLDGHDKALVKFYDQVVQAMLKHIDLAVVKVIVIASPGFVREQFHAHLLAELQRMNQPEAKQLLQAAGRLVLAPASSGHKHALAEVLASPALAARFADTKYAQETSALERFYKMLSDDPARAFYGFAHVRKAAERGAVDTLLVTDELFRSADLVIRKQYIALVDQVVANGGRMLLFSAMHLSGEQLGQLGGVACVCHFPCPEIEDEIEAEASSSGAGAGAAAV